MTSADRSVTGYTQDTSTRPGPHEWPFLQAAGYPHQDGRRTSAIGLLEHVLEAVRQATQVQGD